MRRSISDAVHARVGNVRRLVITAFIVVVLASLAVSNMPEGGAYEAAYPVAEPFLVATGLDQRWRIFAPNPNSATRNASSS